MTVHSYDSSSSSSNSLQPNVCHDTGSSSDDGFSSSRTVSCSDLERLYRGTSASTLDIEAAWDDLSESSPKGSSGEFNCTTTYEYANENTPLISRNIVDESAENRTSMFKSEFKTLTQFALPIFVTHVLEYTLLLSCVLSLGHISTTALAACTLGTMTANVTSFSVILGFTSALDTLLPPAWTSHSPEMIGVWCQRMAIIITLCLIPMFVAWFKAEPILLALKQDPEVAYLAASFLKWLSIGMPAYAFNCISRRYFQSQGLFDIPTRIIFIAAPVNALLTYALVWAPSPLPSSWALGFIGAPLATAITYNLIAVLSVVCAVWVERQKKKRRALARVACSAPRNAEVPNVIEPGQVTTNAVERERVSAYKYNSVVSSDNGTRTLRNNLSSSTLGKHDWNDVQAPLPLSLRTAWHKPTIRALDPKGLATIFLLGLGGVGQMVSEWWAWEIVGLAASLLGPTALAAQSVLLMSCSTMFQVYFSVSVAASVRIGNLLGEHRPLRARTASQASMIMGIFMALFISFMFVTLRDSWSYIFNNDPAVSQIVSAILPLCALFQIFDANVVITAGILRSRGMQVLGAMFNLSAYYIVGVPLGIFLAYHSVPGLFVAPPNFISSLGINKSSISLTYPPISVAITGLCGLWIGLTVALIITSFINSFLCLTTKWEREVEKVITRDQVEREAENVGERRRIETRKKLVMQKIPVSGTTRREN